MDGDAVIQVYVKADSPYAPIHPRLCGFRRVSIKTGEILQTDVKLDCLANTVVNERGEREEVQHMTFYVGMSQPDSFSVKLSGVQPSVITI